MPLLPCVFKYAGSNVELHQHNHPYEVDFCGLLPPEAVVQQLQRRVAQLLPPNTVQWYHAVKLIYNGVELTAKSTANHRAERSDCDDALTKLKSLQASQNSDSSSCTERVEVKTVTIHVTLRNPISTAIRALESALPYNADFESDEDDDDNLAPSIGGVLEKLLNDAPAVVCNFQVQLAAVSIANDYSALAFYENVATDEWLYDSDANQKQFRVLALIAVTKHKDALDFAGAVLQNDFEVVMTAVSHHGSSLRHASAELKNNFEVVKAAVANDPDSFQYADPRLRNNWDIFKLAVKSMSALANASYDLRRNKEAALLAVTEHPEAVVAASKSVKRYEFLMVLALQGSLCTLAPIIKKYREFQDRAKANYDNRYDKICFQQQLQHWSKLVLAALTHKHRSLQPDDVRQLLTLMQGRVLAKHHRLSKQLALAFVRAEGFCLRYVGADHQMDSDVVLAAVRQNGQMLMTVNSVFQDDVEVVTAAVQVDGHMLKYASLDLRDNDEIVNAAIKAAPSAFLYASKRFQTRENAINAVSTNKERSFASVERVLNHDPTWKADFKVVMAAVKAYGHVVRLADPVLRYDRRIALAAVSSAQDQFEDPAVKYFFTSSLQQDEEIALEAVKQHPRSFSYIGKQLFNNKVVCAAVQTHAQACFQICEYLQSWGLGRVDRDVLKHAVAKFGFRALTGLDKYFSNVKDDLELVSLADTVTRQLACAAEYNDTKPTE